MQQVVLVAEFFKRERQAYQNWRLALWRELFQNAIDQKKTTAITIHVEPLGSNGFRLCFADNGAGMTRETLETVYFAVGASSKTDADGSIGGMGRARMMTCFAMESWSIRSQDYAVIGRGGSYRVESRPFQTGCELVIEVDDCSAELGIQMLHEFLLQSKITATVTLNGEILALSAGHLGRHIRYLMHGDTAFARVYVNKGIATNRVIIRVNGVSMYTVDSDVSGQVVVELVPELSRAVLTSNRDGMHWKYARVLNTFTTELSVNTRSATQSVRKRRTTMVAGGGALSTLRKLNPQQIAQQAEAARQLMASMASRHGSTAALAQTASFAAPHVMDDNLHAMNPTQSTDLSPFLAATFGDIFLFDETENAAMRRVIGRYQPDFWRRHEIDGRMVQRGATIIKVLLTWKTLIEYAIELYLDLYNEDQCTWSVGFVFDDNNRADHRQHDGRDIFSLKPVDENGKLAYALSARADLKRLMTLAKHEVTHIRCTWHNEAFSGVREQIDMVFDDAEALRRVKAAIRDLPF